MTIKSQATTRDRFLKQIAALQAFGQAVDQATQLKNPMAWFVPDANGWSGNPLDLDTLEKAFDTTEIVQDFTNTVKDAKNPGVIGDLSVVALQADFLAALERAYKARYHSAIRCQCHSAARRMGHSDQAGTLAITLQGYVEFLVKQSKGQPVAPDS